MTVGTLRDVSLDDRYDVVATGDFDRPLLLSGTQALVRLPLLQAEADRSAGFNTGGFISGYRGSPLGGYDQELWRQTKRLAASGIVFQPGLNEELAATALWGTQQTTLFPGATVDGVFGLWYGKAPGVDRSGDVMKHANAAGTAPLGGVLAICGDDHDCKSSTFPGQSEFSLIAAEMPVLAPASVGELIELGLAGIALSRFSGLWVGFLVHPELMDSSLTLASSTPRQFADPVRHDAPWGGPHIRLGDTPVEQERRLRGLKLPSAIAFARANRLNRLTVETPAARIGIAAAGKAYATLIDSLSEMGIAIPALERVGIRIAKIGMPWPLDPTFIDTLADGLDTLLLVEDKRAVLEPQIKGHLFGRAGLAILGKQGRDGLPLFPDTGSVGATDIARAIIAAVPALAPLARAYLGRAGYREAAITGSGDTRTPLFCSGCPHNRSTQVPEGSRALGGIGCHFMVTWMDRSTPTISQMGGEGMQWLGQAPFTTTKHVFANLGDGTYMHSGALAIRAAVAAGATMTYKLLYNDAVAMTGGQPLDGRPTGRQIAGQLLAEGVAHIAVVAEQPEIYAGFDDPRVSIHPRTDLDAVQADLATRTGVTVLLFDQVCATEKRRRRKRQTMAAAPRRAFINEAVCEGCGDCGRKSSCVSVTPVDTDLGRKRRIDQSSCNSDLTCVEGFCPSFVTVEQAEPHRPEASWIDAAARRLPPSPLSAPDQDILFAGIGGTGVSTVSAIVAMAAHLDGLSCAALDMTGLAQKGGAVLAHLRIRPSEHPMLGRIPDMAADIVIASDLVVAVSAEAQRYYHPDHTLAIGNQHVAPTFEMVKDGDHRPDIKGGWKRLARRTQLDFTLDATRLSERAFGNAQFANLVMLGAALQRGLLPIGLAAIERAIELNNVAIEDNRRAVALGRLAAAGLLPVELAPALPRAEESLDRLVERRTEMLTAYQNAAYAGHYRALVARARAVDGDGKFARAVAQNLAKLMAYKDEYEVARLHAAPEFMAALKATFGQGVRPTFHLAPPLLARRDPVTGEPRKREFGSWMLPVFKLLASLRVLRGSPLDPFGWTAERREERSLVTEYQATIADLCARFDRIDHDVAAALAGLPETIRGYGPIKHASIVAARQRQTALMSQLDRTPQRHDAAA